MLNTAPIAKWEDTPCCPYQHALIDKALLEEYSNLFLNSYNNASSNASSRLEEAGAVVKHKNEWWLTNAGCLFFCSNPQGLFPRAYIRFVKYGVSIANRNPILVAEKTFRGSLPAMLRMASVWAQETDWLLSYPISAIGEAIVNAAVHGDYALHAPVTCKIYNDACCIGNAGGILQIGRLPQEFLLGDKQLNPYPRNPKLAEWSKTIRIARRLGVGSWHLLSIAPTARYISTERYTKIVLLPFQPTHTKTNH